MTRKGVFLLSSLVRFCPHTAMGLLQRVSVYSAIVGLGGYYVLHQQLVKKFPDIAHYELPSSSQVKKFFPPQSSKEYIAYCDTFKTTVSAPDAASVTERILQWPTLKNLVREKPSVTGALQGHMLQQTNSKSSQSTILKWFWNPSLGMVSGFEWIAQYGYPWRMMNGGLHEILVQKVDENRYDVYFVSAHEYNNLRDGKTLPSFFQALHRDFGRLVLYFSTKDTGA